MPAPLGPHPDNPNLKKLNFLNPASPVQMPDPGGRPTETHIIQLEAEFDPVLGEGFWQYYCYPNMSTFTEWEEYRRFIRRILIKIDPIEFESLMSYLHDFKVLNLDLKTGEVYPVIPRPTGYMLTIPQYNP